VRRVDVVGDRRGVQLEVTPHGRRALDDAESAMAQWLADVLRAGPAHTREGAIDGLARLTVALDCHRRLKEQA
jgi:DNA-binding MarR family transcriptional regulator